MSNFKMPTAYHPSNAEWVRPIESLTSDGVRELQRLKAENDKLRGLLRVAYNCTKAVRSCLECRIVAGGCTLLSAMRELGVEVE